MRFLLPFLVLLALLAIASSLSAQTITSGQEQAKATINFTNLANYYLLHPDPLVVQDMENEAESVPTHPYPDSNFIHRLQNSLPGQGAQGPVLVIPNLPPSPAPIDSFEAVLDNNTTIPPDTHGAVDSNYCVTAINPNVRIQSRTGTVISTVSLNSFWNSVNSTGATFDPRIYYDNYAKRWIIVTVAHGQTASSTLLVGVSQTSNPTGNWYLFSIVADNTGTNWFDFPNVGFNKRWLVVTGNYFSVSSNAFAQSKIFVFNIANLFAGTSATYTSISSSNDFTVCPAIMYDTTSSNMFMAETWDGSSGLLKLLKLSGTTSSPTMTTIGYPATTTLWQSDGPDAFAPQLNDTDKINTNDDRITQLILMNNHLWCAHTIFLPYSASANPTRCSVMWWETDTAANPLQNGKIDDATGSNDYAFPSIAVNTYNDALIGFSNFSASIHPSASYAMRSGSDPADSIRLLHTYRAGQNTYFKTYSGTRNRWGDYSGATIDPLNLSDFWTIQEASSGTVNVWDTWWAQINTCNLYSSVITPSGSTVLCSGGTVTLNADTGTGGYAYQWQIGGSNITGATSSAYTAAGSGTYTLIVTKNNCVITSSGLAVSLSVPVIGPITGLSNVCPTGTINLADTTANGTWSSDNTAFATVNSLGVVTGVAAGNTNIVYTLTSGVCIDSVVTPITVNAAPVISAITGPSGVCVSSTINLNNTTLNGTWSSNDTTIAKVNSAGAVSGIGVGTTSIVYTVTNIGGCSGSVTKSITVNALPVVSAISGATAICVGAISNLNSGPTGGSWGTSNSGIATVSSIGHVVGIANGTANISYAVTNTAGCTDSAVTSINVHALPVIGAISGPSSVCVTDSILLSDTSTSGSWSSDNASIGSISSSGYVTGVNTGSVHILYTETNSFSCIDSAVKIITVIGVPAVGAINGGTSVCTGSTVNLSSSPSGGSWTASNSTATVTGSGVVSGVAAGIDTITYTFTNSCGSDSKTKVITINQSALPGTITGDDTVCVGASVTLTHTGSSGAWNSNNTNASVSGAGVVIGINSGKDTITYSVNNSCGTVKAIFPVTVLSQHYCDSVSAVTMLAENTPLVKVYPNPNAGSFVVDISAAVNEPVHIKITNAIGQLVNEYTTATNKIFEIKLEQASGIYFLSAYTSHSRYTTKVTITK